MSGRRVACHAGREAGVRKCFPSWRREAEPVTGPASLAGVGSTSRKASLSHPGKHFGTLAASPRLLAGAVTLLALEVHVRCAAGNERGATRQESVPECFPSCVWEAFRTARGCPARRPGGLTGSASSGQFAKHFRTLVAAPAEQGDRLSFSSGHPGQVRHPDPLALPEGAVPPESYLAARTRRARRGGTAPPRTAPPGGRGR